MLSTMYNTLSRWSPFNFDTRSKSWTEVTALERANHRARIQRRASLIEARRLGSYFTRASPLQIERCKQFHVYGNNNNNFRLSLGIIETRLINAICEHSGWIELSNSCEFGMEGKKKKMIILVRDLIGIQWASMERPKLRTKINRGARSNNIGRRPSFPVSIRFSFSRRSTRFVSDRGKSG